MPKHINYSAIKGPGDFSPPDPHWWGEDLSIDDDRYREYLLDHIENTDNQCYWLVDHVEDLVEHESALLNIVQHCLNVIDAKVSCIFELVEYISEDEGMEPAVLQAVRVIRDATENEATEQAIVGGLFFDLVMVRAGIDPERYSCLEINKKVELINAGELIIEVALKRILDEAHDYDTIQAYGRHLEEENFSPPDDYDYDY